MGDVQPVVRARRSAFAAAFLSLLYPGLGHAYLGRWLRALAWAILPTLAIAGGAGLILSAPDRTELFAPLLDPAMSTAVYGVIVIDLLYRLAAVFDAYRLARDSRVGSSGSRMLSTVGLLGIILVLIASHVAVARPVSFAYDTINDITDDSGDETRSPRHRGLSGASSTSCGRPSPTPAPSRPPSPSTRRRPSPRRRPGPAGTARSG